SWRSDEGAEFSISGSSLTMGVGPTRRSMPLKALGNGRFLFTLTDGPWTKRICL
ncbi:serine hydrolase domain-containing protein, partial [Rhizobium sp. BR5]